MMKINESLIRCAVVLAAGEGQRLRPLIRRLRGDLLPKQYINFIGNYSLLENSFYRAERLVPRERVFTVVSRNHLAYREVWKQLSGRARGTVIIQPENKDTGPGLLLPLIRLSQRHPDSNIAVFPSDHFIETEDRFIEKVKIAFQFVEHCPSRIVLLGINPHSFESDYGYILPGETVEYGGPGKFWEVCRFVEKPSGQMARDIIEEGGLWNSFVMIFNLKTMLNLIRKVAPSLFHSFERIGKISEPSYPTKAIDTVYRRIQPVNFSKDILQPLAKRFPSHLSVLQVNEVLWSDWGSEPRILKDLEIMGYLSLFQEKFPAMALPCPN